MSVCAFGAALIHEALDINKNPPNCWVSPAAEPQHGQWHSCLATPMVFDDGISYGLRLNRRPEWGL